MSSYTVTSSEIDIRKHLELQGQYDNLIKFLKYIDDNSGVDTHKLYTEWQKETGLR